ncbi:MAG: glycosyltransferase family 4 protein [Candidatus Levybacteria bacterium]|nr:glycosyltransferase family 4 protein [Candidatus Levybacteria bacterium]
MKIGIDARFWNETGVGRYVQNLIRELAELDRKNHYIIFLRKEEFLSLSFPENFEKRLANIQWHTIREQVQFTMLLQKEDLDLMHFTYFSIPLAYSKPFVVTIHDLILHHYPTGKASILPFVFYQSKLFGYKVIMKQAAKRAKKIITVSHATKSEIVDHLKVKEEKVAVIYEGVDKGVLGAVSKNGRKKPYFLYVGNTYPHKNVQFLADAFLTAFPSNTHELLFVGRNDFFTKRFKAHIEKKNASESIHFLHSLSDKELGNLYRNAVSFVLPSLMEGFGLPCLEAMANKTLVLASDIPSLREICQTGALYFDPTDQDSLVKRLREVVKKEKSVFAKQLKEGYTRAMSFSWRTMAQKTLRVYESSTRL